MQDETNNITSEITLKFQKLIERVESDPRLKKEVMSTIQSIENIATLLDIFTIKLIKTESAILTDLDTDTVDK